MEKKAEAIRLKKAALAALDPECPVFNNPVEAGRAYGCTSEDLWTGVKYYMKDLEGKEMKSDWRSDGFFAPTPVPEQDPPLVPEKRKKTSARTLI